MSTIIHNKLLHVNTACQCFSLKCLSVCLFTRGLYHTGTQLNQCTRPQPCPTPYRPSAPLCTGPRHVQACLVHSQYYQQAGGCHFTEMPSCFLNILFTNYNIILQWWLSSKTWWELLAVAILNINNNDIVAVLSCIEAYGSVSYFTTSVHIAPLVPANTGPESNPSSMNRTGFRMIPVLFAPLYTDSTICVTESIRIYIRKSSNKTTRLASTTADAHEFLFLEQGLT